jgi:hypothetical protein
MKALARAGQNLAVLILGTVAGSVGFALLLGLAWLPSLSR